ncbi:hypothetical protein FACS1894219_04750 [Clostridia bacterium]|nr:hypothetical protein FACS1894219_04750 [Clostridia bacterium]
MNDDVRQLLELDKYFKEDGDYTLFSLGVKTYMPHHNVFCVLDYFFNQIPDEQKHAAILNVYTMVAENNNRQILRYLRAVKPLIPIEMSDAILALADDTGNIKVYRGGVESKDPSRRISWTTSLEVADFFANRFSARSHGKAFIYQGTINTRDVFAYTDERKEKEIVQHCGVKGISVVRTIARYG